MYFSRPWPLLKEALNDFKIETGVQRTQLDTSFLHKRRVEKVIACPKVGTLGDLAKSNGQTRNDQFLSSSRNFKSHATDAGQRALKNPATTRVSEIEVKLLEPHKRALSSIAIRTPYQSMHTRQAPDQHTGPLTHISAGTSHPESLPDQEYN